MYINKNRDAKSVAICIPKSSTKLHFLPLELNPLHSIGRSVYKNPQPNPHLNQPFSLNREMASIRLLTSSLSRITEI